MVTRACSRRSSAGVWASVNAHGAIPEGRRLHARLQLQPFLETQTKQSGGVVSGEQWPILDYRNGAWLGDRVRAHERLATLVRPDTRVVPANGRLITGSELVRHRDIYQELFRTMIAYMNQGLGSEEIGR